MKPTRYPLLIMPAWITLTADDLKPIVVADQLEALRTEALAAGQADPFTEIAPSIVAKVRAYIASNPSNQVSATAETVPPELKLDVAHLILAPMLGRLGIALTDDQRKQVEIAHTTLIALRDQKLVVSKPLDPVAPDTQSPSGSESITPGPNRNYTRDSLDAL